MCLADCLRPGLGTPEFEPSNARSLLKMDIVLALETARR